MNIESRAPRICPHLGLKDDADTSLGFPSVSNYCHRSDPISRPRFKHQQNFCLGGKYGECPLFLSQTAIPLSDEIKIPEDSSGKKLNHPKRNLAMILAGLFVLLLLVIGLERHRFTLRQNGTAALPPPVSHKAVATVTSPPEISDPLLQELTLTPAPITSTPVESPSPVDTSVSPSSPHQLNVLIGTDYKFVIHVVGAGENLNQLAAKYNTTVDAIVTVNYFKKNPGWIGTTLVIPTGFSDAAKLPSFIVYQVSEQNRGISVEEMAKYLQVSAADLKYYNGWTNAGDRPLVGDYLLVPRRRPMP